MNVDFKVPQTHAGGTHTVLDFMKNLYIHLYINWCL